MSAAAAMGDPTRTYIVTLRNAQRLSQSAVADGSGMKPRTYIAWENGETERLDLGAARSIVAFLGGAFSHLETVNTKTAEEAKQMALDWLRLTPEERAEAQRAVVALERIAGHADGDPERLQEVIEILRDRARDNPALLDLVTGFLAGLGAKGGGGGQAR